ncbi:MAG: hypothetical protein HEP71_09580 [Roseivirga sp.]|nr:hypothetical protein [Roseivirga sp.]
MKRIQSFYLLGLCLFFASACSNISGLSSNSFEQRFPITRCGAKVQVNDPDANVIYGQFINQSKGIWLLTPYLALDGPEYANSEEDLDYINTMNGFLVDRIESKFIREKWIEDVVPFDLDRFDTGVRDSVVNMMVSNVIRLDTINYGDWKVPNELIQPQIPGYSLFLFIDGNVGFDRVTGNENILYLFVIDNATRKTTYADFMKYRCDVRNTNGLDKTLDYAYKKLLELRFPSLSDTN